MKRDTLLSNATIVLVGILTLATMSVLLESDDPYGNEFAPGSTYVVWKSHHGDKYEYDLDVTEQEFTESIHLPVRRSVGTFGGSYELFLTPENPHIIRIAEYISNLTDSDKERALLALNFVQCAIDYIQDSELYGCSEHFAYPIETLYLRQGDCEDSAFLTCSIMLAMNLDAVLLDSKGHLSMGVCIKGEIPSEYVEYDGKKYGSCSTTASWPTTLFDKSPADHEKVVDEKKDAYYIGKKVFNESLVTLRYGFSIPMEKCGIERGLLEEEFSSLY